MTIDIERLKTDAAYWDECGAPEWATKFGAIGMRDIPVWYNLELYQHAEGRQMNRVFRFASEQTYSLHEINGMIPRPSKPSEVEWVDGLPPVGCECEVRNEEGDWLTCEVVAHHQGRVVLFLAGWTLDSDYDALPASDFRPIKTPEQRQREELVEAIADQSSIFTIRLAEDVADAIIKFYKERYNLEPKK